MSDIKRVFYQEIGEKKKMAFGAKFRASRRKGFKGQVTMPSDIVKERSGDVKTYTVDELLKMIDGDSLKQYVRERLADQSRLYTEAIEKLIDNIVGVVQDTVLVLAQRIDEIEKKLESRITIEVNNTVNIKHIDEKERIFRQVEELVKGGMELTTVEMKQFAPTILSYWIYRKELWKSFAEFREEFLEWLSSR